MLNAHHCPPYRMRNFPRFLLDPPLRFPITVLSDDTTTPHSPLHKRCLHFFIKRHARQSVYSSDLSLLLSVCLSVCLSLTLRFFHWSACPSMHPSILP